MSSMSSMSSMMMAVDAELFKLSLEVQRARLESRAIVALESTIIAHGMPFPQNVETALAVEAKCRENGAVPATIAILDGVVHIGLERADLDRVGQLGSSMLKVSRRDVAHCVASLANGATTVSATMLLAHRAGIHVFVTGGIGGVHRGGELSMDVSADLTELARTPLLVVCAGVKSILDIGRTVERLETDGVSLVGFGVDEMPAFYSRSSGVRVPLRLDAERDVARLMAHNLALQLHSAVCLCVPIPSDAEPEGAAIERATQRALAETRERRVAGRDITPFVLKRVTELTGGASLAANIRLVLNNAAVGARVAVELVQQLRSGTHLQQQQQQQHQQQHQQQQHAVFCVGGAVCDVVSRPHAGVADKNLGVVALAPGGVARNIASALARLRNARVQLVSVVADDALGHFVLARTKAAGVDVREVAVLPSATQQRTAVYNGLLDAAGDLQLGISDMSIFDTLTPSAVLPHLGATVAAPALVCVDGNLPQETLVALAAHCAERKVRVWFDCTSIAKCRKIVPALDQLAFLSGNAAELRTLAGAPDDDVQVCATKLLQRSRVGTLVTTLGADGAQLATRTAAGAVRLRRFAAPKLESNAIASVNGAGDAFAAAVIDAHIVRSQSLPDAITFAIERARLHLTTPSSKL